MRTIVIALLLAIGPHSPAFAHEPPLPSAQLQDFVGQYQLEDGRTLSITQRRHQLVAQLDGTDAIALVANGPADFVAPGRKMQVMFDQRPNGNVASVTVIAPPAAN